MALTFTAGSADRMTTPDAAAIDDFDEFTFWAWINNAALTANGRIFAKGSFSGGYRVLHIATAATDLRVGVDRATTAAEEVQTHGISVGEWYFVGCRYDETNGIDLFVGSLTSPVAILSGGTHTVGVGDTATDQPSNRDGLTVGNNATTEFSQGVLAFDGAISRAGYHNVALTDGQLRTLQFRTRKNVSSKLLWRLGTAGVLTCPDWSGNGSVGTGVGLVAADAVPLGPLFGFDIPLPYDVVAAGRIMSSLVAHGGLASKGGIAGIGGGLAG